MKLILMAYFLKCNEFKISPQHIISIKVCQIFYSILLKNFYGSCTFGTCEFSPGPFQAFKSHQHLRVTSSVTNIQRERFLEGLLPSQTLGITLKPCMPSYTCSSHCCFYDLNYHI